MVLWRRLPINLKFWQNGEIFIRTLYRKKKNFTIHFINWYAYIYNNFFFKCQYQNFVTRRYVSVIHWNVHLHFAGEIQSQKQWYRKFMNMSLTIFRSWWIHARLSPYSSVSFHCVTIDTILIITYPTLKPFFSKLITSHWWFKISCSQISDWKWPVQNCKPSSWIHIGILDGL